MSTPLGERLRGHELQRGPVGRVGVEARAAAEQHREDLQVQLVDEPFGQQVVHERAAAGDEDRTAVLVLQARDGAGHV